MFSDVSEMLCGERLKWKAIKDGLREIAAELQAGEISEDDLRDRHPVDADVEYGKWSEAITSGEPYCVGALQGFIARLPSSKHATVHCGALAYLQFDDSLGSLHRVLAERGDHFMRLQRIRLFEQPLNAEPYASSYVQHWLAGRRECCVRMLSNHIPRGEWMLVNSALSLRPAVGFYQRMSGRGGAQYQTGEWALGEYAYQHKPRLTDAWHYTAMQVGRLLRDYLEHPDFVPSERRPRGWRSSDIQDPSRNPRHYPRYERVRAKKEDGDCLIHNGLTEQVEPLDRDGQRRVLIWGVDEEG
jgi:hypothetical protein